MQELKRADGDRRIEYGELILGWLCVDGEIRVMLMLKYDYLAIISTFSVIFSVQLSFPYITEHASLTFNEFKMRTWNLLQIFIAYILFKPPCRCQ